MKSLIFELDFPYTKQQRPIHPTNLLCSHPIQQAVRHTTWSPYSNPNPNQFLDIQSNCWNSWNQPTPNPSRPILINNTKNEFPQIILFFIIIHFTVKSFLFFSYLFIYFFKFYSRFFDAKQYYSKSHVSSNNYFQPQNVLQNDTFPQIFMFNHTTSIVFTFFYDISNLHMSSNN